MLDSTDTLVVLLCKSCPRRDGICGENPPSWKDAWRCKYTEAEKLATELDQEYGRLKGER